MYVCIHTSMCVSVTSAMSDFEQPLDYSPLGSSIHGILQARILEWVAMPSSTIYIYTQIHIYIYVCVCIKLVLFLWRTLINTERQSKLYYKTQIFTFFLDFQKMESILPRKSVLVVSESSSFYNTPLNFNR